MLHGGRLYIFSNNDYNYQKEMVGFPIFEIVTLVDRSFTRRMAI